MYQGKLVEIGPTQEVFYNPQHPYTQSLLKAANQLQSAGAQNSAGEAANEDIPILSLKSLTKHYTLEQSFIGKLLRQDPPEPIKAVDGVSLDLYPGEILGLVGESGCGKVRFHARCCESLSQPLVKFSSKASTLRIYRAQTYRPSAATFK